MPAMFPTHVGIALSNQAPRLPGTSCSLRMWGLRVRTTSTIRPSLMFPTHVGIARPLSFYPPFAGHVPYACGDCAAADVPEKAITGCSLRMWGLREAAETDKQPAQMFPTHVGIARTVNVPVRQNQHVPYACGDCADISGPSISLDTCSLRMWGLRGQRQRRQSRQQMFPTHVGIARGNLADFGRIRDVPYACGDCAGSIMTTWSAHRCSLRMWGLRGGGQDVVGHLDMFPTHVGIARVGWTPTAPVWHVPYACGDCAA